MQSKSKLRRRKRMNCNTTEETGLLRIEERHSAGKGRGSERHVREVGWPLAPPGKNKARKTNLCAYGSQTYGRQQMQTNMPQKATRSSHSLFQNISKENIILP